MSFVAGGAGLIVTVPAVGAVLATVSLADATSLAAPLLSVA